MISDDEHRQTMHCLEVALRQINSEVSWIRQLLVDFLEKNDSPR